MKIPWAAQRVEKDKLELFDPSREKFISKTEMSAISAPLGLCVWLSLFSLQRGFQALKFQVGFLTWGWDFPFCDCQADA